MNVLNCYAVTAGAYSLTIMVRILERGITLVCPYSRNKSDYTDLIYFSCSFSKGNNSEVEMTLAFNNSSDLIHRFELVK